MFLKQYYLGCLAHASYMIADEETGLAAVVDPQRDIGQYLQEAEEHGWHIRYVLLTHFHADFLAGHIELRDQTGATIYLGRRAEAEYDFQPLTEGDTIEFGNVRIEVLETPGHTPEGISLLVFDRRKSETQPHAVLTGDTLFIGDVGRPDLLASIGVTADELAEMLYDSIHNKIAKLPDETLIYPAHGAGSLCGKNLSDETVSTIGEQKRYNYALKPMSKEEFITLVEVDQPEAPDYFVYDAIKNRQERESLDVTMRQSLRPLSLDDVLQHQRQGHQLVDVREGIDFEGGHLRGAVNIGLAGKYATWAGTVLNHDRPIVVIAEQGSEPEAVMRLGRIGFDNVAGYLQGGMSALEQHPELVQTVERVTAPALAELLDNDVPPLVLDVRSEKEREAGGVIQGSLNIPLNRLEERIDKVPDRPLVVHCAGGYRSAIACSLLQKYGRENLSDLVGGFAAWRASGLPTRRYPASCLIQKTAIETNTPHPFQAMTLARSRTMTTQTIPSITPEELTQRKARGESTNLIDVRTPVEYREVHVPFARNVPLDRLDPSEVLAGHPPDEPLYVVCRSGSRASKACESIIDAGFPNVVNVTGGTQAWEAAGYPVVRGQKSISLERQVRIAAGVLVLLGALLGYFVNIQFLWLSAFVGAGLTFAGITDTCGMGMLLARMPWNQVTSGTAPEARNVDPPSGRQCCG